MARHKDSERTDYIIQNRLRNRNTFELLYSFVLIIKQWVEETGAIGIISKPGRYSGTFAPRDIAFEFASWISIEFKLYLIKEFQRLKEDENNRLKLEWILQHTLAKVNYYIHTDDKKEKLIPQIFSYKQANFT